ncbi:MAG: hypothetical protein QOG18_623 [Microbacteriaceae bacterium]|jgi:hypothetical protein|nr:hypothetical protein [Microbacteriaceae bacterium]
MHVYEVVAEVRGRTKRLKNRGDRRIGWDVGTDPLSPKLLPSKRGQRGA